MKAKKRRSDQPIEPSFKFLGHGICDTFSKSIQVKNAINENSLSVLTSHCLTLYSSFKIPPSDLRGCGIAIGKIVRQDANEQIKTSHTDRSFKLKQFFTNISPVKQMESAGTINVPKLTDSVTPAAAAFTIVPNTDQHEHENQTENETENDLVDLPALDCIVSTAQHNDNEYDRMMESKYDSDNDNHIHDQHQQSNELQANIEHSDQFELIGTNAPVVPVHVRVPVCRPLIFNSLSDLDLLPNMSQLDRSVISELPLDIRKELAEAYKKKRVHAITNNEMNEQKQAGTASNISHSNTTSSTRMHAPNVRPRARPLFSPTRTSSSTSASSRSTSRSTATSKPKKSSNSSISFNSCRLVSRSTVADCDAFPDLSQIDPSVFSELPDSIRAELQQEYERRQKKQLVRLKTKDTK
jgi:hypothetical protein